MLVTPSDIMTLVKPLQPKNAAAMLVTGRPLIVPWTVTDPADPVYFMMVIVPFVVVYVRIP
jgi:hypothetical protein